MPKRLGFNTFQTSIGMVTSKRDSKPPKDVRRHHLTDPRGAALVKDGKKRLPKTNSSNIRCEFLAHLQLYTFLL